MSVPATRLAGHRIHPPWAVDRRVRVVRINVCRHLEGRVAQLPVGVLVASELGRSRSITPPGDVGGGANTNSWATHPAVAAGHTILLFSFVAV